MALSNRIDLPAMFTERQVVVQMLGVRKQQDQNRSAVAIMLGSEPQYFIKPFIFFCKGQLILGESRVLSVCLPLNSVGDQPTCI